MNTIDYTTAKFITEVNEMHNNELKVLEITPGLLVREDGMVKTTRVHVGKGRQAIKGWRDGCNNNGYRTIFDGKKQKKLHQLVAKAFIPNPENKPCVNHINGVKTDNRVENLEWCTYQENNKHAIETGLRTYTIGKHHANTLKITKTEYFEIKNSTSIQKDLAKRYETTQATISKIKNGTHALSAAYEGVK